MNEIVLKIFPVLIIFSVLTVTACDASSSSESSSDEDWFRIQITNNTSEPVTVYYAREKNDLSKYGIKTYSKGIPAGEIKTVTPSDIDGLRSVTVFNAGKLKTFVHNKDFTDSIIIN